MTTPRILTIILNYRTPDMTLRALAAARDAMAPLSGEIVVVDNGSGDASCEIIPREIAARGWDRDGRVRFYPSARNGGFGAGNNFGMAQGLSDGGRPDYIFILNSDAFPDRDAIKVLLEHLEAHPEAGMAGSYIEGEDGVPHQTAFRFPTIAGEFEGAVRTGIVSRFLSHAVVPLAIPEGPARVDWCAGASVLMRQDMLDKIGTFDEMFFLYFEETDLCRRAARAGWQVWYLPRSRVVHVGSVSTGMKTWKRTPGYWFDSRLHYFVKNHGRGYAIAATIARLSGEALWRLRARLTGRPFGAPSGFLRDLAAHSLRAAVGRKHAAHPGAGASIVEDLK